jgi:hypothetical protein
MVIVDDYIRAFLQVVAYHKFLKGGVEGDGPSKDKFIQHRAQRIGNSVVLQKFLLDMPGEDELLLVISNSRMPRFSAR